MEIVESNIILEKKIVEALSRLANKALVNVQPKILNNVRASIREAIEASPEYDSILNGELRQHFGLIAPGNVLDNIIEALVNDVEVTQKLGTGSNVVGGLTYTVAKPGFASALNASGASYISKGNQVNWLQWLLEKGTEPAVREYHIFISEKFEERSRAGYALMIEGGEWNVPAQYSGTPTDNWFTRALSGLDKYILKITEREMKNAGL